MGIFRKFVFFASALFFLWLSISIPQINELFTLNISSLTTEGRVLLQYSSFAMFVGSMMGMAFDGDM